MYKYLVPLLIFSLVSGTAFALPTPDVLVSISNIIPLLIGAGVTFFGGIYYGIRKLLGSRASERVVSGLFGLFVLLIGFVIFLGYLWNEDRREQRINDIAMYLRCDIGAHEAYLRWNNAKGPESDRQWRKYGNFNLVPIDTLSQRLHLQPEATLIASYPRSIEYQSGIPAVEMNGELLPFDFVRPLELPAALRNDTAKDLYLVGFRYIQTNPEFYPLDKSFFSKYETVYIVMDVMDHHRYVYDNDGVLRPADVKNKIIKWPVRNERWILDEKRVHFPGIVNLLPTEELADLLGQEDVYLVAPFNSAYRSREIHEATYLSRLLGRIDPQRVISVDMNGPSTSSEMESLAKKLDGARFVVVGTSKNNWLYEGIDFAFEMWERLDHDPDRFKLAGFNTRLPESVAIHWEAQTSRGVIDMLYALFWRAISWLQRNFGLNVGAAIIVIAILLRLLFYPVGIFEARSRTARATIKKALKGKTRPLWGGSSQALLHHLKVRGAWELLGTLVMLILVLPAYQILSNPPEDLQSAGFLWIDKLTEADLLLSIVVGALLYFKMRLGATSAKARTTFLICLAFVLLLLYLPSSLLLYVIGVLTVTTGQDLMAVKHTNTIISRALLKAI